MRFSWRPTFYLLTAAHNRAYCRADDKSHNGDAGTHRPRDTARYRITIIRYRRQMRRDFYFSSSTFTSSKVLIYMYEDTARV